MAFFRISAILLAHVQYAERFTVDIFSWDKSTVMKFLMLPLTYSLEVTLNSHFNESWPTLLSLEFYK